MRQSTLYNILCVLFALIFLFFTFLLGYFLRDSQVSPLFRVANEKLDELRMYGCNIDPMASELQKSCWSHNNMSQTQSQRVSIINSGSWGENLYYGECDIRKAIGAWENSTEHKHVLEKDYRNAVILIKPMDNKRCYIVMDVLY